MSSGVEHSKQRRQRLDTALAERKLVASRSQAESYVRLGQVRVNGVIERKPGRLVGEDDALTLTAEEQYVSRAALKLKSAAEAFRLNFRGKIVLDVGSSTGGFTQYALQHGAATVIAVDVGTDQMHPSLRNDERIRLYEKTDIRDVLPGRSAYGDGRFSGAARVYITDHIDLVVCDVSFISLREILPHVAHLMAKDTVLVAMVKPQFEAGQSGVKHKGVIKNDRIRRDILKGFEAWAKDHFVIIDKADSAVAGSKGNLERFYSMRALIPR